MLLAIDIGNSNIVFGVFDGNKLKETWRIETEKEKDEAYYRKIFIEKNLQGVNDIVIGSVVPELDGVFGHLIKTQCKSEPLFVSTALKTGIANLSEKPTGLGADRLADIVAAIALYPGNRIIIDLGTASKFEAVSEKNDYLGGAISPGVGISFNALIRRASKLNDVKLQTPKKVVGGFTTEEHLNSGYIHGFAAMTDGMIERMKGELDWKNPTVILTGGFTDPIAPFVKAKLIVNKNLTTEGLRILWEKNK